MSDKDVASPAVETILDHISGHLSKAIVITSVLRGIRHNAVRNRCYVPLESLVKYKISQQELLRCQASEKMRDLFFDLACVAKSHLDKSKKLLKDPQVYRFTDIFLPLIFCDIYLTRLEKEKFDIFSETLATSSPFLPYQFYYRSLRLSYLHYWAARTKPQKMSLSCWSIIHSSRRCCSSSPSSPQLHNAQSLSSSLISAPCEWWREHLRLSLTIDFAYSHWTSCLIDFSRVTVSSHSGATVLLLITSENSTSFLVNLSLS